jgi:aminoglycoside phosphotransferase (APT) family kinase protein
MGNPLMADERDEAGMPDYQAFLMAKHERLVKTPPGVIDEIVRKATGSSPTEKQRIIKGEANEVHAVKIENSREVIVRINRESEAESRFQSERWAIEQAAKADVPVPRVLLVESLALEGKSVGISVEERLPGIPLDELATQTSDDELAEILRRAGTLLSRVHSVTTEGFGEIDKHGRGEHASIAGIFSERNLNERVLLAAAQSASLDPNIVRRALHVLREFQKSCPPVSPHLLHGDFAPKHLLIENGKITGVIDFENACGGDPVLEFARWQFFFENRYPIESLKNGYSDKSVFGGDFERRFVVWRLMIGLSSLSYYVAEGNQSGINHCKKRIPQDISYIDRTYS